MKCDLCDSEMQIASCPADCLWARVDHKHYSCECGREMMVFSPARESQFFACIPLEDDEK